MDAWRLHPQPKDAGLHRHAAAAAARAVNLSGIPQQRLPGQGTWTACQKRPQQDASAAPSVARRHSVADAKTTVSRWCTVQHLSRQKMLIRYDNAQVALEKDAETRRSKIGAASED